MRSAILTIAGSDSSGGAGIQADLKSIAANGGYGASVVTAITAQNTIAVDRAEMLPAALVRAQLQAVFSDLSVAAVKSGMLGSDEIVRTVADCLRTRAVPFYVCDPVMISKTGHVLLSEHVVATVKRELLPLASVVTPNVHEAAVLAGFPVADLADAEAAGRRILEAGPAAVLVKGGHLKGAPGTDVLVTRSGVRTFRGEWVDSPHTHGTGCTYSAAIAAWLGRGAALEDAIARAKEFMTEAIRAGVAVGAGVGPTDPFFFLRTEDAAREWVRRLGAIRSRADRSAIRAGSLHVITDETIQSRFSHAEIARLAAEGGADVVQFREKRPRTTAERIAAAERVALAIEGFDTRLIVNDRANVALAVGAVGVHVGRNDLPPRVVRRILGPAALVGATVNSLEEALTLSLAEISYLGAGSVFPTRTKAEPAPALGLDRLREIVNAAQVAVIAVGAIVPERVSDVLETGVRGIAVASAVVCDADPAAATARFRAAINAATGRTSASSKRARSEGAGHAAR